MRQDRPIGFGLDHVFHYHRSLSPSSRNKSDGGHKSTTMDGAHTQSRTTSDLGEHRVLAGIKCTIVPASIQLHGISPNFPTMEPHRDVYKRDAMMSGTLG